MSVYEPEVRDYLISSLKEMISPERWAKFLEVISFRTKYLTVVLEDIYQPHNASAVIRTCELMGIHNLHVIENQNPYEINPDIVVGSNKWIDIYKHNTEPHNTLQCFEKLRKKGYSIVATSPHNNHCIIEDLPLDQKTALVFGNEGFGLSPIALENADSFVRIPSVGFTESYNISVSVALCLYRLTNRLNENHQNWQLTVKEQNDLLLEYAIKSVKNAETVVKILLENYPSIQH